MYCPICGQKQISEDTRFCSRCGFLLTGVSDVIANGGNLPLIPFNAIPGKKRDTLRKKGVKKGLMIFLSGFLIVPLLAIFSIALQVREPFIVAIAAVLLGVGGVLRMIYALLFEPGEEEGASLEETVLESAKKLKGKNSANALPPQTSIPISDYAAPTAGTWRDTNDLTPSSVVENTTRQLRKDEDFKR